MSEKTGVSKWKVKQFWKLFFIGALLIMMLSLNLALAAPAAAATTVVAEQTAVSGLYMRLNAGVYAQIFTTGPSDTYANAVSLRLLGNQANPPATIRVSITETTESGLPNDSVLCSGTFTRNFYNTIGWWEISLGSGASLAANTRYAIVATADPCPGYVDWQGHYIADYAGGTAYYYSDSEWVLLPNVWSGSRAALGFQVLNVIPDYSLTVATNPAGIGSTTGSGAYEAGTTVSIGAPPSAEYSGMVYNFDGWTGADVADASSPSTTLTMPASATTVTANYVAQPTYAYLTVTTDPAGIDSTTGNGEHEIGAVVTITAPENVEITPGSRYHFSGWTGAGVVFADASSPSTTMTMPDSDTTVTANYVTQYYLTVDNGGHGMAGGEGWYDANSSAQATLTSLTVDGDPGTRYVFAGWSGDADGSGSPSNDILMDGPKTATATWATQYQVTFDQSGINDSSEDVIVTVNGVDKTLAELPFTTDWFDSGSTLTYAYSSPIAVIDNGTQLVDSRQRYVWNSTSGLSQDQQGNTFSVTAAGTVTATYNKQYRTDFNVGEKIKTDCTTTILTVNGEEKRGSDLLFSVWTTAGESLSYEFTEVLYGTSGMKYVWWDTRSAAAMGARTATIAVNKGGRVDGMYCGTIVTASPATQQYSDQVTFEVTTTGYGGPLGNVHFFIGTQDMGEANLIEGDDSRSASLTVPLLETVSGAMAAGNKTVTARFYGNNVDFDATTSLTITREDAAMTFESADSNHNPVAVQVSTPGGNSGTFTFEVHIAQDDGWEGNIGLINASDVTMSLFPVGSGSPITKTATSIATISGVRIVNFTFDNVPVNTYDATVTLNNNYFTATQIETVLTVYDPSLGFTTGGGWFYWPDTADPSTNYPGDKTNFGYTIKYGKNGSNLKGNLLLIRHLPNGDIFRIKSNALDAGSLTLGTTNLPMGWATFSGKCNYTSILSEVNTTVGNTLFKVYVEDRNEPGTLADLFWIQVTNCPMLWMAESPANNAIAIDSGSIFAPHSTKAK